jgi:NAD(P)H-dependent FMN reductase
MFRIALISSSIRTDRKSHRVALFFKKMIEERTTASAEILDLAEYHFPLFEERLSHMEQPPAAAIDFSNKIKSADGIIIVTPEYNGGYPASLKNAIDLLYPEWKRKPVGLAAVSNGQFGGSQVLTSLVFTLIKMGATVVPNMYRAGDVQDAYDEAGNNTNPKAQKMANTFLDELTWYMEAKKRMEIAQ